MMFSKRCLLLLVAMCVGLFVYSQQTTYVIVHGAWGGAWQFKKTASELHKADHIVYRPTLTGLGDRYHLRNDSIDLDVHIQDVVNTILFENLNDIVLVGHSYGGMVITGVADSIPGRIRRLVYLDAILAEDGKSALESLNLDIKQASRKFKIDGTAIIPTWVRDSKKFPKDVPHPAKTFTQPIRLSNLDRLTIPTTYIFTYENSKGGEEKDDFYPFYQKAIKNSWKTYKLEASHNPQIDKLDDLVQILLEEK